MAEEMADMPEPERALAGIAAGVASVALIENGPAAARIVLRCRPDVASLLGAASGLDLGGRINTARLAPGCAVLKLGPDEWLLIAEPEADPWLGARLGAAAGAGAVSIVDVSHARGSLVVAGPSVEAVLAAGIALPLTIDRFPVDRATRTLLGKSEVVLWRRAPDRFHFEVGRSFLPYVAEFLSLAIAHEAAIAALPR
jgi:sarcosine oxidase subunit gamma